MAINPLSFVDPWDVSRAIDQRVRDDARWEEEQRRMEQAQLMRQLEAEFAPLMKQYEADRARLGLEQTQANLALAPLNRQKSELALQQAQDTLSRNRLTFEQQQQAQNALLQAAQIAERSGIDGLNAVINDQASSPLLVAAARKERDALMNRELPLFVAARAAQPMLSRLYSLPGNPLGIKFDPATNEYKTDYEINAPALMMLMSNDLRQRQTGLNLLLRQAELARQQNATVPAATAPASPQAAASFDWLNLNATTPAQSQPAQEVMDPALRLQKAMQTLDAWGVLKNANATPAAIAQMIPPDVQDILADPGREISPIDYQRAASSLDAAALDFANKASDMLVTNKLFNDRIKENLEAAQKLRDAGMEQDAARLQQEVAKLVSAHAANLGNLTTARANAQNIVEQIKRFLASRVASGGTVMSPARAEQALRRSPNLTPQAQMPSQSGRSLFNFDDLINAILPVPNVDPLPLEQAARNFRLNSK